MKVLVVVPPERFDFYNYLSGLENCEFILLWHVKHADMPFSLDDLPLEFSTVIYWDQFSTPQNLLKKVRPNKIIFFEIIDLRQIALIVAARNFGITTFYLEHGAAGDKSTAIARWNETTFQKQKLPYLLNRFKRSFADVLKSKRFYYSVIKGFDSFSSYTKYFKLPLLMLQGAPNKVLANCKFRERVPTYSIVFNHINYEQFEVYTGISADEAVLTGVPFFDKYYRNEIIEEDHIIFIDHPYLEEGLLGWNKEHHRVIAEKLFRFAERNKIRLYIKLHPISKKENWTGIQYDSKYVEVLQYGDFTELYLKSKLILGFSSSLITGFLCAKKNVVLLGWHPKEQIFGVNFSDTGLCHKSLSPDELDSKFNEWIDHNLAKQNEQAYNLFLQKCNYPFDGRATERVLNTIIDYEVY